MPHPHPHALHIVCGFAVALCIGAGANRISLSSGGPAAEAVGPLSVNNGATNDCTRTLSASIHQAHDPRREARPQWRDVRGGDVVRSVQADAPLAEVSQRAAMGCGVADLPVDAGEADGARSRLVRAIEQVESGGRADAVGDGGRAIGCLQIHACVVADVNEWLGEKRYALADRLDPEKSREMFHHYIARWCPDGTDEEKARSWNGGGPRGRFKKSTESYWLKVQEAMRCQK